jgi:flagellar protein FliO/FliZ
MTPSRVASVMKIPALPPSCAAAVCGVLLAPSVALAANGESTPLNLDEDGGRAAVEVGGGSGGIVRTIVGLAIVIAVIYGLTWVLRQVKASREGAATGAGLHTLATLPLGQGRSLQLVRAGAEVVLVGVAEHGVTPIRTYTDAEARALGLLDAGESIERGGDVTAVDAVRGRHGNLASDVIAADAGRGRRLLDELRRRTVIR